MALSDRDEIAALPDAQKRALLHDTLSRLAPASESAARMLAYVDGVGLENVSIPDAEEVLTALLDLRDQKDAERKAAANRELDAARERLEEAARRERLERGTESAAARDAIDRELV